MKSISFKWLSLVFASLFFVSCASKKDLLYLQNVEEIDNIQGSLSYEPKLQKDDLLSIIVAADQPELTIPFNLSNQSKSRRN
jgi:polysaccharide export outer membrane protein